MNTNEYTTKQDAINYEIIPAIEAGEAKASEYDIEAIADEVITEENGTYTVDADIFWDAVARHAN